MPKTAPTHNGSDLQPNADIERLQREAAKAKGFELQDQVLALYGLCSLPGCRPPK